MSAGVARNRSFSEWPWRNNIGGGPVALRPILVAGVGTSTLAYQMSVDEQLSLMTISADIDTTGANSTPVQAVLLDPSGIVLARVATGAFIDAGQIGEATFGVGLPDSSTFGNPFPNARVQTGLWDLPLLDRYQISVSTSDPAALVTQVRLLVGSVDPLQWDIERPAGGLYYELPS